MQNISFSKVLQNWSQEEFSPLYKWTEFETTFLQRNKIYSVLRNDSIKQWMKYRNRFRFRGEIHSKSRLILNAESKDRNGFQLGLSEKSTARDPMSRIYKYFRPFLSISLVSIKTIEFLMALNSMIISSHD